MARKFIEDTSIGRMGCKMVSDGSAQSVTTETYYAVQFITDCTPTVFTIDGGDGTFSGITYSAGIIVYGDVRTITCGSGEAFILYKA